MVIATLLCVLGWVNSPTYVDDRTIFPGFWAIRYPAAPTPTERFEALRLIRDPEASCTPDLRLGYVLRAVGADEELLSWPEGYFRHLGEFAGDLAALRGYYVDLKDAPKSDDSHRFDGYSDRFVLARCEECRASLRRLHTARPLWLDRDEWFSAEIDRVNAIHAVWTDLGSSRWGSISPRRKALARIRDLLTDREWALGTIPTSELP